MSHATTEPHDPAIGCIVSHNTRGQGDDDLILVIDASDDRCAPRAHVLAATVALAITFDRLVGLPYRIA